MIKNYFKFKPINFAKMLRKNLIAFVSIFIFCAILLGVILPIVLNLKSNDEEIILEPVWRWECRQGKCQKLRIISILKSSILSLPACKLLCSKYSGLWPQPTGTVDAGKYLIALNKRKIKIISNSENPRTPIAELVSGASRRFKKLIEHLPQKIEKGGNRLSITLDIFNRSLAKLTLETNESYKLRIKQTSGEIHALISAENFFGARHGLETLGQLIIYDDLKDEVLIVADTHITDSPAYPYRGIMLDTSRNYISVDTIKRTLDGMASSKLNTFHWHITDSTSFPYVSKSRPQLSLIGAYTPSKVYTRENVADIIQFGKERGIRVVPEFDAPAHVGAGWQDTGFLVCFNGQPWQYYCVAPPCGQLDPTKSEMYDVLEDIYKDMVEQFEPDIFHMGGDEVHFPCWKSVDDIVVWMNTTYEWQPTKEGFVKLWNYFQEQALKRLLNYHGTLNPVVMWTNTLTERENVVEYLPIDKYILQVWTNSKNEQIDKLLEKGYKIILSNYDALYLDCGFAGWVTNGTNWCTPYKGWQKIYDHSPVRIAGDHVSQVLGAEVALWTEQADDTSVDSRVWPRAAALAERVWSEPETTWKEAEQRMLTHRERLVKSGIAADCLEPEWCYQNEGNCPQ